MNEQTTTEPTTDQTVDHSAPTPLAVHTVITRCRGQFPIPQPAVRIEERTEAPMTVAEAKRKARDEFRAKRKAYLKEYHKHYVRPAERARRAALAKEAGHEQA